MSAANWTLLVYRIPSQPTRLRLQIWRKLQRMGALYLQDAVCILPARPDLDENLQYIAESIAEMGGTYHLFHAQSFFPEGDERLAEGFQDLADTTFEEIAGRVEVAQSSLSEATSLTALEAVEEDLKRERVAYLRARRLAFCGSNQGAEVEARLDALRHSLDNLHRNGK